MDIKEAVGAVMREYMIPELESIKEAQLRADVGLSAINKRLDDVNQHLVDQSRRMDAVREELNHRMDTMSTELNNRIDTMSTELNNRIVAIDGSMGRLHEVIVRREEHSIIVIKLNSLEQDVRELKQRFAA